MPCSQCLLTTSALIHELICNEDGKLRFGAVSVGKGKLLEDSILLSFKVRHMSSLVSRKRNDISTDRAQNGGHAPTRGSNDGEKDHRVPNTQTPPF
jgi:hypothetical protein